nr:hypothetical protein [Micromonospora sp. DSM 115978]
MIFSDWVEQLRASGHLVCPASSGIPVELWGVRPDGVGFHFRCRGVQVRLALYRPGRARWQVPVWDEVWCPEEALQLWEHRPVTGGDRRQVLPLPQAASAARLVFVAPEQPDDLVVYDGSVEAD